MNEWNDEGWKIVKNNEMNKIMRVCCTDIKTGDNDKGND